MDYQRQQTFDCQSHAGIFAGVVASYESRQHSEQVTLQFDLKGNERDQLYAALAVMRQLRHDPIRHVQCTEDQPPRITVGPCYVNNVPQVLSWLTEHGWLHEADQRQISDFFFEAHRSSPRHLEITQDAISAGLEAFDFAVSDQCNVLHDMNQQHWGRAKHFQALRATLADPVRLLDIARNSDLHYLREDGALKKPARPDAYLSLQMMEPALRRMAVDFAKVACIRPIYGDKREYVGDRIYNPDTDAMVDAIPSGHPDRPQWTAFVLKNIRGITYEESQAMLKGIEAYDQAVRNALQAGGQAHLDAAYEELDKRQRGGHFSAANQVRYPEYPR